MAIFSAMNDLGALLLTRTNITNITTDNIGKEIPTIAGWRLARVVLARVAMVLVRPNCQSEQSIPEFGGYEISSG